MTKYELGINLIGSANRFPEPEVWTRLVREEFDLDSVCFSTDLVDPLWPKEIVEDYVTRTRDCLEQHQLTIPLLFFGIFTRRNLLMAPDPKIRQMWFEWYKGFVRLAVDLGAKGAGSPFGAISVHDASDPQRRQARIDEALSLWQELSFYAKDCGLEYLYFETMSTKREIPDTIKSTIELYERMNENAGVPTFVCQDIGHAPNPAERDRYQWLRELGHITKIVHLQQTDEYNSRHWPFTPQYNIIGVVDPLKTLEAIEESGAEEMVLGFEIFHRDSPEQESRVIPEIKQSVAYWREYLGNKEVRPEFNR
jgi:sugar phosphate isomerase/epimerase